MSLIKKKKHVSKKNKKAWRKYCDIQDVEDFLEDQRLDERQGKLSIEGDNDNIFDLDIAGAEPEPVVKVPQSAKQRKRARLSETPTCFEALLSTSKVPDPNAKRNHVNPVGSKPTALSKLTEKRRYEKGIFQRKIEMARKNRKIALEKKRKTKQYRQNFDKDIWSGNNLEAKGIPESLCDEFISPEAQLHNVPTTKRIRPKPPPPKTLVTRAAIETPHPGVSYNPSYQAHQELLQEVMKHEEKMMKKEAHLNRVTTGMFRKVTAQQNENQWKEEMSMCLPQPDYPTENPSGSESDNEYKAINPPVKNKKKDHKARRKQKERLLEKERLRREKIEKKKITDLYKLRKLESLIVNKEDKLKEEKVKRKEKRAALEATAIPTLNAKKVPMKEPEFIEPSQLSGELRSLKSHTNILKERYESLQRRGALAAAKLMMKKKKRVKSYFKSGFKVTEQDVDNYIKNFKKQRAKK